MAKIKQQSKNINHLSFINNLEFSKTRGRDTWLGITAKLVQRLARHEKEIRSGRMSRDSFAKRYKYTKNMVTTRMAEIRSVAKSRMSLEEYAAAGRKFAAHKEKLA